MLLGQQRARFIEAGGEHHPIPGALQQQAQQMGNIRLVFDDQQPGAATVLGTCGDC